MRIRSLLRRWPVRWTGIFCSYWFLLLCLMKILKLYQQPAGVYTSQCNLRNSTLTIFNFQYFNWINFQKGSTPRKRPKTIRAYCTSSAQFFCIRRRNSLSTWVDLTWPTRLWVNRRKWSTFSFARYGTGRNWWPSSGHDCNHVVCQLTGAIYRK